MIALLVHQLNQFNFCFSCVFSVDDTTTKVDVVPSGRLSSSSSSSDSSSSSSSDSSSSESSDSEAG